MGRFLQRTTKEERPLTQKKKFQFLLSSQFRNVPPFVLKRFLRSFRVSLDVFLIKQPEMGTVCNLRNLQV